jgi:hypothetical protein
MIFDDLKYETKKAKMALKLRFIGVPPCIGTKKTQKEKGGSRRGARF